MRALTLGYIVARETRLATLNSVLLETLTQDVLAKLFSELLITDEIQTALSAIAIEINKISLQYNEWKAKQSDATKHNLTSAETTALANIQTILDSWQNPLNSRSQTIVATYVTQELVDSLATTAGYEISISEVASLVLLVASDPVAVVALAEAKEYLTVSATYLSMLNTYTNSFTDAVDGAALSAARTQFLTAHTTPISTNDARTKATEWLANV